MSAELALFECAMEFARNCKYPMDSGATATGLEFFDNNFGCLIRANQMNWAKRRDRQFALTCAGQLGKEAQKLARAAAGPVTKGMMQQAARNLIPDWEKGCHLPPSKGCGVETVGMLTQCVGMRSLVRMAKTAPKASPAPKKKAAPARKTASKAGKPKAS